MARAAAAGSAGDITPGLSGGRDGGGGGEGDLWCSQFFAGDGAEEDEGQVAHELGPTASGESKDAFGREKERKRERDR